MIVCVCVCVFRRACACLRVCSWVRVVVVLANRFGRERTNTHTKKTVSDTCRRHERHVAYNTVRLVSDHPFFFTHHPFCVSVRDLPNARTHARTHTCARIRALAHSPWQYILRARTAGCDRVLIRMCPSPLPILLMPPLPPRLNSGVALVR